MSLSGRSAPARPLPQSRRRKSARASVPLSAASTAPVRHAPSPSFTAGALGNAKNAAELLAQPDIDGGLIGGASLKPVDFATIIAATNQE
ncbi:MAG: triose-phosphate isomerase [Oscillospiraceae bacterium]